MVTLKRYLDGMGRPAEPRNSRAWPQFATALVDSVSRHVLEGEHYHDIREDLRLLSEHLSQAEAPPESGAHFDRNIEEYRRRSEDASQAQCRDMRRMLASMNEALLILAGGSDCTVDALKQMETTLAHAATLNDISSLKSRVNDVIKLVAHETVRQREESSRAISELHQQIAAAKTAFHPTTGEFPEREEAVSAMTNLAERNLVAFAGVFVLERIPAIVVRYGKETAEELFHQLIRERIQTLAPDATAFAWSEDTAVLLIQGYHHPATLNEQVRSKIEVPFEHRIVSGGRVAMLKASVRCVVLPIHRPISQTIHEIDAFSQGGPR